MKNECKCVRNRVAVACITLFAMILCACSHAPILIETTPSDAGALHSSAPAISTTSVSKEHTLSSTTSSVLTTAPITSTASAQTTETISTSAPLQTTEPTPPETVPAVPTEPVDEDMVLLSEYLPEAILDIRYATTNNFTGQIIYEEAAPRLRYGTVKKLRIVCERLEETGLRLVIWDAWRPAAAQWKLWNICPDPTFVSDPTKGYSSHTKGGTVDITLAYADGTFVEMPTDFDDFSKAADLDFSDVSPEAAANATLLQQVMSECGFRRYRAEWWHFTDTHTWEVMESLPD